MKCELKLCSFIARQFNGIPSGSEIRGAITPAVGGLVTSATQCQNDRFSISSPGNPSPPVICGTNTDEHSEQYL